MGDKVVCPKCDPLSKKKWVNRKDLQEHIKKNHIDWGEYDTQMYL